MTQDSARRWWHLADDADHNDSLPVIPTASRMRSICEVLAPVLYAHLNFDLEVSAFWDQVQGILTALSRTQFPNPLTHFSMFVLFCYTFRDLLKPQTVAHCIFYAEQFCVGCLSNFFLGKFLIGVADPELAIDAFLYMQTTSFPQWVDFVAERGNIARLFDLFLPDMSHAPANLQLTLAELLADLVLTNCSIPLRREMAASLIDTVLGLIEQVPAALSVAFARCALRVCDAMLEDRRMVDAVVDRVYKLTQKHSIYRHFLYRWMAGRLGPIDVTAILAMVTRHSSIGVETFSFLENLVGLVEKDAAHVIVVYLAQCLIQKVTWARIAGRVLTGIFAAGRFDDICRRWFLLYIRLCFMTIRLAAEAGKYRARATAWLAAVTECFQDIDWVRSALNDNSCLACSESTNFLSCFFTLDHRENDAWAADYAKFVTRRQFLKVLPFKPSTSILISLGPDTPQVIRIDEAIARLNVDAFFARFLSFRTDQPSFEQQQQILRIEEYRDREIARVDDLVRTAPYRYNLTEYRYGHRSLLVGFNALLAEYETLMARWQQHLLEKFLRNSQLVVDLMRSDPTLSINSWQLAKQYDRHKVTRPTYMRLKRQAQQIRSTASAYAGTLAKAGRIDWLLTSELSRVMFTFIPSVHYSPPSGFDDIVFRKIAAGDELEMLRAIVLIAAADETSGTIQTVTELVQRMLDALSIERGAQQFAIVFTSVIRIVFDRAYVTAPSLLSAFADKSAHFAATCERAERMTVAALGLTQGLLPGGNNRKQIGTVFRHNRMPNLAAISFYTNPIDLVYQIHLVVNAFTLKTAPGAALAHGDVVALLYAAIVAAPPAGALGIAKFLAVWEKLVCGEKLAAARRAFLEAMQRIYPIDQL
jgi:hypothetical protein